MAVSGRQPRPNVSSQICKHRRRRRFVGGTRLCGAPKIVAEEFPPKSSEELTGHPGIFFALFNDQIIWQEAFMGRAIFLLVILAVSAAVAFFACGRSDEPRSSQANAAPAAPGAGSPASANKALEKAVKVKLDTDERLKTANLNIDADVTKNQVTLSGTVDSEAFRSKAVELAKSAQVGVVVNDKINVKARQSNTMPPMPPHAIVLV
jgi:BON domain